MKNKKSSAPMRPMGGGRFSFEKPKDFKGTFKKLMKYISQYKVGLLVVIIFAVGSTIFSIIGPKILGNATTLLFEGVISKYTGGEGINFAKIATTLLTLLGLYILSLVFSYIQGYIMTGISQKVSFNLRKALSEKINRLPMSYFDQKTHGEILTIVTNDIDTLTQSLNQIATQFITSVVTIVGVVIMMFSINVPMTLISLLMIPLSFFLTIFVIKKSQKYFKAQQDYLGFVNGKVEEMFSGHTVLRAFNAEEKMINSFEKDNKVLYQSAWKSQFLSGLMHPIMHFVANIGYAIIAILGGYYAIQGTITVGNIQSFIQYMRSFTHPIVRIANGSNMFQSMIAAAERVFEFLEEKEMEIAKENIIKDGIKGNVEFQNVSFGYKAEEPIIKGLNIKLKAGEKVAIVGPTGAGKTTIVKLLMGFYPVNEGSILIDGYNVNDLSDEAKREIFGMVLQDTWLFTGTIMENIRYGNLRATDEEVIKAAKAASVHNFIKTLPSGYNMELNEESDNVSSGQKQLLTIARAILADPKILILDEATSNVDTRTEVLIQKTMEELMKGRTTFVIAHRLSTIRSADLILVIDEGKIVEQGRHEELLAKNGFYAKLYNSQFED